MRIHLLEALNSLLNIVRSDHAMYEHLGELGPSS